MSTKSAVSLTPSRLKVYAKLWFISLGVMACFTYISGSYAEGSANFGLWPTVLNICLLPGIYFALLTSGEVSASMLLNPEPYVLGIAVNAGLWSAVGWWCLGEKKSVRRFLAGALLLLFGVFLLDTWVRHQQEARLEQRIEDVKASKYQPIYNHNPLP